MSTTIVNIDADLRDLIPQFVENRKKDIQVLEGLVEQKDFLAIANLAHRIKGAAAGYGFSDLSDLAAEAESAAKSENSITLSNLVRAMKEHFYHIEIKYVES